VHIDQVLFSSGNIIICMKIYWDICAWVQREVIHYVAWQWNGWDMTTRRWYVT
jgi:hypothetical protein